MADRTNTFLAVRGKLTRDQVDGIAELTGFDPEDPQWNEGIPTASDWHDHLADLGVDYAFLYDAKYEWDSGGEFRDSATGESGGLTTDIGHTCALVPLGASDGVRETARRWEAFMVDFPTDGSGVEIVETPEPRTVRFVGRVPALIEIEVRATSREAARALWRESLAGAEVRTGAETVIVKAPGDGVEGTWSLGPTILGTEFGPPWPAPDFVPADTAGIVWCETCGEDPAILRTDEASLCEDCAAREAEE